MPQAGLWSSRPQDPPKGLRTVRDSIHPRASKSISASRLTILTGIRLNWDGDYSFRQGQDQRTGPREPGGMVRTGSLAPGAAAKGTVCATLNSAQNHRKHRNKSYQFLASPKHPPHCVFLPLIPSSSHFYNPLLLPTATSEDSQKLLYQSQAGFKCDCHPHLPPKQCSKQEVQNQRSFQHTFRREIDSALPLFPPPIFR